MKKWQMFLLACGVVGLVSGIMNGVVRRMDHNSRVAAMLSRMTKVEIVDGFDAARDCTWNGKHVQVDLPVMWTGAISCHRYEEGMSEAKVLLIQRVVYPGISEDRLDRIEFDISVYRTDSRHSPPALLASDIGLLPRLGAGKDSVFGKQVEAERARFFTEAYDYQSQYEYRIDRADGVTYAVHANYPSLESRLYDKYFRYMVKSLKLTP